MLYIFEHYISRRHSSSAYHIRRCRAVCRLADFSTLTLSPGVANLGAVQYSRHLPLRRGFPTLDAHSDAKRNDPECLAHGMGGIQAGTEGEPFEIRRCNRPTARVPSDRASVAPVSLATSLLRNLRMRFAFDWPSVETRRLSLDAEFPLDDGESVATTLANDLDAELFLWDVCNQRGAIHASLAETRFLTIPHCFSSRSN